MPKSLGDTAWIRIGKEGAANRSVQSVRVEPLRRRLGWRISAEVANHGGLDEQITVHLLGAGGSQERQVRVGSGKSSPIEFVLDGPVSGKVQLRLSPADLFGLDDSALISLPDIPRASVTLVTPGKPNPFWKSAVVALGAWIDQPRSRTVISREWPPAQGVAPGGPFEVVILEGVRLRKQLVRGRYLLFDVQGASGVPTGSKRLNIGVWQVDRTHPVMRHVSLTELLVRSGRPLKPRRENGIHALARGPDGLLILAGRRRQLSIIQFAFTLEESNLAGLIAFPLILKNALLWFASDTLKVDVSAFAGGAESRLKVSAAGKRPRPGQIASRLRHHGAQLGLASAVLLMLGLLLPPLWVTRR